MSKTDRHETLKKLRARNAALERNRETDRSEHPEYYPEPDAGQDDEEKSMIAWMTEEQP